MQAPRSEVRVCSIFAPISSQPSEGKLQVQSSPTQCPLSIAWPVPPFVPPCRYALALQARTTDTAAVRCGAQPGAGCPCATRRRSGVQRKPRPASPESFISRGRVRPMCSGEPAPNPTDHWRPGDGTPHPLIRSASAMHTLYLVLLRCEMRCGLLPVRLCQVFIISSYTLHGPASKRRPCAPAATSCCRTRRPLPC